MGFYLGLLLRASSWNILIVCPGFGLFLFFSKGRNRKKQVLGADADSPSTLGSTSWGWEGKRGLGRSSASRGAFWGAAGGSEGKPPSSHPAGAPHSSQTPGKGQRSASPRRVSPSAGCCSNLKIALVAQQGKSIPLLPGKLLQAWEHACVRWGFHLLGKPFGICLECGCERRRLLRDGRHLRLRASPGRRALWTPHPQLPSRCQHLLPAQPG